MAIHEFEQDLAFVFEEHLVLGQLTDREQVSDQALIQRNFLIEGEVDSQGVENGLHVAQLIAFSDLRYVHHVAQAEESIDIDTGLQVP